MRRRSRADGGGAFARLGYTQTINKVVQTCQATRQTGTDDLRVKFRERSSRVRALCARYDAVEVFDLTCREEFFLSLSRPKNIALYYVPHDMSA